MRAASRPSILPGSHVGNHEIPRFGFVGCDRQDRFVRDDRSAEELAFQGELQFLRRHLAHSGAGLAAADFGSEARRFAQTQIPLVSRHSGARLVAACLPGSGADVRVENDAGLLRLERNRLHLDLGEIGLLSDR
ncbi:MAG: hypothetical protein HY319_14140 [Armatimonadetes bacterium]|nr:hypothetical protein [Armatimonadota bacterium]